MALQGLEVEEARVVAGPLHLDHLSLDTNYVFKRVVVPLRELEDNGLTRLSREGQLSLNLAEMRARALRLLLAWPDAEG